MQSEVTGQTRIFRTSKDETTQINAILRINELRGTELRLLKDITDQKLRSAGLDQQVGRTQDRSLLFRQQKDLSESAVLGIKGAGSVIGQSGDAGIAADFARLNEQIDAAKLKLSQGIKADNLIDVTTASTNIRRLSAEIDALRLKASDVTTENTGRRATFDQLKIEETKTKVESDVGASLRQQAVQGISSKDRQSILESAGQIKILEAALQAADKAFDGSEAKLLEYIAALIRLNGVTDSTRDALAKLKLPLVDNAGLGELGGSATGLGARGDLKEKQQDLQKMGSSFNNLSNNAYQAGQAFEDFAVGFSLNGLAGGIRGAANNVAFILNDMSRLPGVTNLAVAAVQKMKPAMPVKEAQALGAKYASMIPLAAGIGSAFAIVVIPKMVEWLQSLTEVEVKLNDISDKIKSSVSNLQFDVGLQIESSKFEKDLEDARDIESVVSRTNDLIQKRDENQQKISAIQSGLTDSGGIQRTRSDLVPSLELLQKARTNLQSKINENLNPLFGAPQPEIAQSFIDELEVVQTNIGKIQDLFLTIDKIDDPFGTNTVQETNEEFIRASELLQDINKELDDAKEKADGKFFSSINADDFTKLKANFKEIGVEITNIAQLAKANEIIDSFNIESSLTAIIEKNKELAFGIRLARQEAAGTVPEGSSVLSELFDKNDNLRKQLDASIIKGLESSDPKVRDLAIKAADAANQNLSSNLQLQLETAIKKAKDQLKTLEEKDKKSEFTNIDDFVKKLQINALSSEDQKLKATKDLILVNQRLIQALEQERQDFQRNISKFSGLDNERDKSGIAERIRKEELRAKRGVFGIPIGDEMEILNGVIDSIKETFSSDFNIKDIVIAQVAAMKETIGQLLEPLNRISGSTKETVDAVKRIDTTSKVAP